MDHRSQYLSHIYGQFITKSSIEMSQIMRNPYIAQYFTKGYHCSYCLPILCLHWHHCKNVKNHGAWLTNSIINVHLCHTSLVSCNYGLPEQHMQACILDNQSPVTLAIPAQFSNPSSQSHYTHHCTLALIRQALEEIDHTLIPQLIKIC